MVDVGSLLLAIPVLAAGAFLVLQATGSQTVCFSAAPCPVPTDAWQPFRLGGGLLAMTTGSTLVLTALWRHGA
jgi:hypothetical protein